MDPKTAAHNHTDSTWHKAQNSN